MAPVTPPDPLPPDENVGPTFLAVSGVLIAFIVITSSLRIFVRSSLGALGLDDYTMVVVAALCVARFALQVVQVNKYGNGRHRWYISPDDYMNNNMLGWYAQVILFLSMCLLKVSICLLILRIKKERGLKIFLYALMAGLFITNFGCVVILLAQCRPISAYWTGVGVCWDTKVRIYAIYLTIAYSLLTDVICSLLPLLVIQNVRLPFTTKASLCCLMGLGILATGFGIARAASLGLVTNDLSWVYCIAAIWSNLELFLGVIAANLALSRSIYVYLRYGRRGLSNPGSKWTQYPSRSAYINKTNGDDDAFGAPSEQGRAEGRRNSVPRSESSDLPLRSGIRKTTDFIVLEEALPGQNQRQ
ncbi:hypothetical protein B0T14DRAFT_436022 [Immersiella caudata]|uniref:Rhodopsin domain-containing protein n=1 Tax=Immersiella caudata TaxID=314043 RepID=A0AA40BWS7_9PEZI|nr:hypothetical protein B0T14DRAFT_436022 [Immersiella caudata]